MRLVRCLAVVVVLSLGGVLATPVSAHEATPTVEPVACDGPQASADALLDLWYSADGTQATPPAAQAATEITIPIGSAADEATVAAIEQTVHGVFACFAAGDYLRAFAFFSEDLQRLFGPEPGTSREDAAAFISSEPQPDPMANELVAITDVMLLADGSAGAFVVERDPTNDTIYTSYGILVQVEGQWLVESVTEFAISADDEG